MPKPRTNNAFSLVELSIVLVILGLLVGGILAGQSLIHASELRAVGSEQVRYRTATLAFRDKYMALPGDMVNATSFWGKDSASHTSPNGSQDCSSAAGTASTSGTCNGNGDGKIDGWNGSSWNYENFRLWQQLSLAGLIEGTYPGYPPSSTGTLTVGGVVPASKLNAAGWSIMNRDLTSIPLGSPPIQFFSVNYNNYLSIGGQTAGNAPIASIITPAEAWNIDTKLDDGKPARGNVLMRSMEGTCTDATTSNDLNASYALTITTPVCALWFRNQF